MRLADLLRSLLLLAALAGAAGCDPPRDPPAGVPPHAARPSPERLGRLRLGVNLSYWLWLSRADTPQQRREFISDAELRALATGGMTHARLPFEPTKLWDKDAHELRAGPLAELDEAIRRVLASGLAVVVDAHDLGNALLDVRESEGRAPEYERFWDALAAHLASTDPQLVFLELCNEPHGYRQASTWSAVQAALVRVVRARCPAHTLICTGDQWGGTDGLHRLTPPPDANVVYSFHFYDPDAFTHQGATWGVPTWKALRDVPYPLNRDAGEAVARRQADPGAAVMVRTQADQGWDAAMVRAQIKRAADWGTSHGAPLYCGEFGVYAKFAPRAGRGAWLRDMTAALDEFKIGRAMWDYCGGFDLAIGEPGLRTLDRDIAEAIGVKPPPSPAPPGAPPRDGR